MLVSTTVVSTRMRRPSITPLSLSYFHHPFVNLLDHFRSKFD